MFQVFQVFQIFQVFQMKIGKVLQNIKERKKNLEITKMWQPFWVNVWSRMYSDGFYLTKTEKLSQKIWANKLRKIWGFTANLELNLNRVINHVGANDLRYSQDPQAIPKSIIVIDKKATNNKKDILILSIIPRRDNSIANVAR